MELVYQTENRTEALALKSRFEQNGIPAFLAGEQLQNVPGNYVPKAFGVWVYVNEQLSDARNLITNPEHRVANPVNVEEFYRLTQSANNTEVLAQYLRRPFMWALGIVSIIVVAYAIYKSQT